MIEIFYKRETDEYSLYIQVTDSTHFYDVLTIISHDGEWKEDRNQFSEGDYRALNFQEIYQTITETEFGEAQNNILKSIGKTRDQLKNEYYKLWYNYLVQKIRIEEHLIESGIDLTDYWKVVNYRQQKELELDVNEKRDAIQKAFSQNNPQILSNEDIFNKVASTINNRYLLRRAQIQAKVQL